MYIVIHDHMGRAQRLSCTRAVLYDDLDNPLSLGVEWQPGAHFVSDCNQPDFNQVLKNLGISRTVVCTELGQTPIEQVRFDTIGL